MAEKRISKDLLILANTGLDKDQIQRFYAVTPKDKIRTRPAKGGGFWKFVAGSYVIQVLNVLFGPDGWSFEITTSMSDALATANTGTVVVSGRLTVYIPGKNPVVREQFGRKDVTYRVEYIDGKKVPSDRLLDFGNDLKAAGTDALKKCASQLGLFADVYTQEDFFEATIIDSDTPKTRSVTNKWVPSDDKLMNTNQKPILMNQMQQRGINTDEEVNEWLWENYGVGLKDLTESQAQTVIEAFDAEYKDGQNER